MILLTWDCVDRTSQKSENAVQKRGNSWLKTHSVRHMYQNDMQIPKSHDALFIVGERSITLMHVVPIRLEPTDRLHGRSKVHLFEETDIRTGLNQRPVGPNLCIGTTAPTYPLEIVNTVNTGGIYLHGSVDNTQFILANSGSGGHSYSFLTTGGTSNLGQGKLVLSDGTARLTLDAGNVGIGTTAPRALLHVAKDGANASQGASAAFAVGASTLYSKRVEIGYDTSSDAGYIQGNDQGTAFKNLALNPSGGNVGIGTTNPQALLDIGGGAYHDANIPAQMSANSGRAYYGVNRSAAAYGALFGWDASYGTTVRSVNGNDNLSLVVSNTNQALTINPSGNVGIGTTNPAYLLQVGGNPYSGLSVQASSSPVASTLRFGDGTGWKFNIGRSSESSSGPINTGSTGVLMTVQDNGYVGIGTTSPTAPLHVYGSVDGAEYLTLQNASSGTNAHTITFLANDTGASLVTFLNSSNRSADGGVNTGTIRNDAGDLRLQSKGGYGLYVASTTGNVGIGTAPYSALSLYTPGAPSNTALSDLTMVRYWVSGTDTRASSVFHYYDGTNYRDLLAFGVSGDGGSTNKPNQISQAKMVIRADGYVGIGTTSPTSPLDLLKNITGGSPATSGTNEPNALTRLRSNSATFDIGMLNSGAGWIQPRLSTDLSANLSLLLNPNGGFVGVGTTGAGAPLHVERNFGGAGGGNWIAFFRGVGVSDMNYYPIVVAHGASNNFYVRADGYTWASAGYGQGSDQRLKKEITTTAHGLEDVLALRGVNYYWKDPSRGHKLQLGLIAQEVEKIVPEVIGTDDKGMKSISYANLVAVLIEAIKQEHAQKEAAVSELQRANAAADASIAQLRARANRADTIAEKAEAESSEIKALLCEKFPDAVICKEKAKVMPENWHPPLRLP